MRETTYIAAINEALQSAMEADPKVLFFGLGATDPRAMFGSGAGLEARFGRERVFDMPTSENGMTGVAIGASLQGYRPVMTHLRLDFFLLAMDQLVNGAAKWHYAFGGRDSVPITIRLVIGRGWGQGPSHSQSLHAWFAHVPGLKVVSPATPADAKGLLLSSIADDNPVVFLEHRWLHDQRGAVPEEPVPCPLGSANLIALGDDVTIVASSHLTIEAIHAVDHLRAHGIGCDLIDLRTVSPIDWPLVDASVRKTGRLLALDAGAAQCGLASEIVSHVAIHHHEALRAAPAKIAAPDCPVPTSHGVSQLFYATAVDVIKAVATMMLTEVPVQELVSQQAGTPHDVPGEWFKGPF